MKYKIARTIAQILGFEYDYFLHGRKTEEVYFARYITVGILKEEGFASLEIMKVFVGRSRGYIDGHAFESFNTLLSNNKKFKNMYLKAVQAVEELDHESENDTQSA